MSPLEEDLSFQTCNLFRGGIDTLHQDLYIHRSRFREELTLPHLEGVGFLFQPVNLSRGVSPPR
ncbi:hypothetical protein, partial [Fischerella thermalis]|uniref:hypothetical protein n=1 Tax=Fischerella thermalis TaxID=372787 RepID=UPI001CA5A435